MTLDVYIVHWNAPEWCASAVASIRASEGISLRIHVVDNGRSGGRLLREALPSDVEVMPVQDNVGYAGGANVAFSDFLTKYAESEFVVIASHDVQVQRDTLALLVEASFRHPEFGVLGPQLTAPQMAGGFWRGWRASYEREARTPLARRDWVSGTLLLVRRQCLQALGGFDITFGSYVEDVDFCLRAKDAGWEVGVVREAIVRELGSVSSEVTYLVDVNSARLSVKRRGLRAVPRILGQYAYLGVRGLLISMVPWRTAERRRASRDHAFQHLRAVGTILHQLVILGGFRPLRSGGGACSRMESLRD